MADLLPGTARILQSRVARAQTGARAPAVVAGVVRDGGLAGWAGAGAVPQFAQVPLDDVQFRIGSITKTVTAIAVLRLRDAGRLDLADRLEQHLPGTPHGDRTLAQLLGHLSGLRSESPISWWERTPGPELDELGLSAADDVLPPGRRFHYSNLGFGLLGEMLARTHGRPWADVVREQVLLPLGMTRTTPRPHGPAAQGYAVHPFADALQPEPEHDAGAMAAAGQLWATLRDLARLGALLIGDVPEVLAASTVEEMVTPQGGDTTEAGWSSYGLGVQVVHGDGATLAGHGGSMPGFVAGLWVDRAEHAGVVLMTNSTAGIDSRPLVHGVLGDLRAAEPHVPQPWVPAAPPVPLDALGAWYWGPSQHHLVAVGSDTLRLDPARGWGRGSRFRRNAVGDWTGLDGYYAGERLTIDGDRMDVGTFAFTRIPYDPGAAVPGGTQDWV